jgi:Lon protease-like protein
MFDRVDPSDVHSGLNDIIAIVSERLDEVLSALPIFPLSVVLFPGQILPLHIFEERYKKLMKYALENGAFFGLSYQSDAAVDKNTPPYPGSIGTAAKINAMMPLEGGRMNLVATGIVRYRLTALTQEQPFIIARVESVVDDQEAEGDIEFLFSEVSKLSQKYIEAARTLDQLGPVPDEFPEEPEAFSLLISSLLPIETEPKQRLLEITSTRLRLTRVRHHLLGAIPGLEALVQVRERARNNGHGTLPAEEGE